MNSANEACNPEFAWMAKQTKHNCDRNFPSIQLNKNLHSASFFILFFGQKLA